MKLHIIALLATNAAALVIPELFNINNLFGHNAVPQIANSAAPERHASQDKIPGKYIVVLKDGLSTEEIAGHEEWVNSWFTTMKRDQEVAQLPDALDFFHIDSLHGYVGYIPEALLKIVQLNSLVKFVEQDSYMHINEFDVQKEAPWGLARVSQRELSPVTDYLYDNEGGKGVTAYIIDTGIKTDHPDFEDRASWGESIAFPNLRLDAHGHGSHVAGTIGSKTYGIAKQVDLVAVGVMNVLGSGTTSDIIKGVEFVVKAHQEKVNTRAKGYKGSTVNMSIGGGASEALDLAVNAGSKAGLHIAVAAGNEDQDACDVSPARASGPITVGAVDNADWKALFSNWGKCVDVQAPGVDILSVGIWLETATMSGTSMAAPHVTGLLSYFLSFQPGIGSEFATELVTPVDLKRRFIKYGTTGVINGLDAASPNILAFNGAGANITDFWGL